MQGLGFRALDNNRYGLLCCVSPKNLTDKSLNPEHTCMIKQTFQHPVSHSLFMNFFFFFFTLIPTLCNSIFRIFFDIYIRKLNQRNWSRFPSGSGSFLSIRVTIPIIYPLPPPEILPFPMNIRNEMRHHISLIDARSHLLTSFD